MSWVAFDRTERSMSALLKAIARARSPEHRAAVSTELVVVLQQWLREANDLRYEAITTLHQRGWSVDDLRERFGVGRNEAVDADQQRLRVVSAASTRSQENPREPPEKIPRP